MKKIILAILIIIVVIVTGVLIIKNKTSINSNVKEEKIAKLCEYGENLEKMDIPPNTIVARFNGNEILFREIETKRKSLNYMIESKSENMDKSAFYNVLKEKLYVELAKTYPNEVEKVLNIKDTIEKTKNEWMNGYGEKNAEEYREDFLDILCIKNDEIWLSEDDFITYLQNISAEQMLFTKGIDILFKLMVEKPELAKDKSLEEKVKKYNEIQESAKTATYEEKSQFMSDEITLIKEIEELYTEDLILNSKIELCVDKNELSYTVPTIYTNSEN